MWPFLFAAQENAFVCSKTPRISLLCRLPFLAKAKLVANYTNYFRFERFWPETLTFVSLSNCVTKWSARKPVVVVFAVEKVKWGGKKGFHNYSNAFAICEYTLVKSYDNFFCTLAKVLKTWRFLRCCKQTQNTTKYLHRQWKDIKSIACLRFEAEIIWQRFLALVSVAKRWARNQGLHNHQVRWERWGWGSLKPGSLR